MPLSDADKGSVLKQRSSEHLLESIPEQSAEVAVSRHGVIKHYFNSHVYGKQHKVTPYHREAAHGNAFLLEYALQHGVSADTCCDSVSLSEEGARNCYGLSLLHYALENLSGFTLSGFSRGDLTALQAAIPKSSFMRRNALSDKIHNLTYDNYQATEFSAQEISSMIDLLGKKLNAKAQYTKLQNLLFTNNHMQCIDLLLKYGADVNAVYTLKTKDETSTHTPLLIAARKGFGIEPLLKAGADPNQRWKGQRETPLGLALVHDDVAAVELFFQYRVDVRFLGKEEGRDLTLDDFDENAAVSKARELSNQSSRRMRP